MPHHASYHRLLAHHGRLHVSHGAHARHAHVPHAHAWRHETHPWPHLPHGSHLRLCVSLRLLFGAVRARGRPQLVLAMCVEAAFTKAAVASLEVLTHPCLAPRLITAWRLVRGGWPSATITTTMSTLHTHADTHTHTHGSHAFSVLQATRTGQGTHTACTHALDA